MRILLLLCLSAIFVSHADQIDHYQSDITVSEDGTVDVVETIQISTNHEKIKLGITRDIPTYYYFMNKRVETPVKVLSVERNGKPENFWASEQGNYVEIFTGSVDNVVDNYLDKGQHTFSIHWQSQNHIRSFENYDELYINAIGHNWHLPIHNAIVTLNLPKSVEAIQSTSYYGVQGRTDQAKAIQKSPQQILFIAPETLGNGKGFTVATGFTKGVIPSIQADQKDIIMDKILGFFPKYIQPTNIFLFGTMIIILAYFFLGYSLNRWLAPKSRKAFMVRYSPPENIDLDKTFGLVNTDLDNIRIDRGMTALLVDLNTKGCITIDQSDQTLNVNEIAAQGSSLTESQKIVMNALNASEDRQHSLSEYNHALSEGVQQAQDYLSQSVHQYYGEKLNVYQFFGYVLLAGILLLSSLYLTLENYLSLIFVILVSAKIIAPILINFIAPKEHIFENMRFIIIVFGLVAGFIPIFGMQGDILDIHLSIKELFAFYAALVIPIVIICICFQWITRWTSVLKKNFVDDQQAVLEFKHFLAYTKEEEYKFITPDLFEEYLAYSIIFGVEKEWLSLYAKLYPVQFAVSESDGRAAAYSFVQSTSFVNSISSPAASALSSNYSERGFGDSRGSGGSGSGGGGSSGGGSGGGGGGGR